MDLSKDYFKIEVQKKKFFEKKLTEFLDKKSRVSPCNHISFCNGCKFLENDYFEQTEFKKSFFEDMFNKEIEFIKANSEWEYRNKIELSCLENIGFRNKQSPAKAFNLEKCLLINSEGNEIISIIKKRIKELNIELFNKEEEKGFLRYLSLRYSFFENKFLIVFTIFSLNQKEELTVLSQELANLSSIKGVIWLLNDTKQDVSFGEKINFFGEEFFYEKFLGNLFKIYPNTFFQTNPKTAEKLFTILLENCDVEKNIDSDDGEGNVLDLFCGSGAISLALADKFDKVVGIEENKLSIELAEKASVENGKLNTLFVEGKVRKVLKEFLAKGLKFNTIVLDPPRSGLCKKTIERIVSFSADKILYVGCNPFSVWRDVQYLKQEYEVKRIYQADFFPQTPHVETLVVLEKLKK